jgi:Sec-independent protein secretion pathway component TatC
MQSVGLVTNQPAVRLMAGFVLGLAIGFISSLLGVTGGEIIIPTLVLGFGTPIKVAGSLSLLISLPTVAVGLIRYAHQGLLRDCSMGASPRWPLARSPALFWVVSCSASFRRSS